MPYAVPVQIRDLAARAARRASRPTGYEITRRTPPAIVALKRADIAPASVLDVGAALGDWTRAAAATFPDAAFVMIEPLSEFEPALRDAARATGAKLVAAAAGQSRGEHTFHVHRDLVGSSLFREREGEDVDGIPRSVPMTTVDDVVSEQGLRPPFLLKLDVQGAELEVLTGATGTLGDTVAVLAEASFFPFWFGGIAFGDLVAALADRGFVVYDIENLARRPMDGALAQADVLFVPEQSPLRAVSAYASREQRKLQDAAMERVLRRKLGGSVLHRQA